MKLFLQTVKVNFLRINCTSSTHFLKFSYLVG